MSPKLFLNIMSMEARKAMSYRADFWINAVLGFVAQLGVIYFLWRSIFNESDQVVRDAAGLATIGGMTFEGMLVYYVLAILLGKLARGFSDEQFLSGEIYDGGLTRYMVYPTSYIPFKYAQQLGAQVPALIQLALFGSLAPFFLDLPPDMAVTLRSAAMACASVYVANLLNFLIYYPVQGVAFWADNVWSLSVMTRFALGFLGGMMIPISLFPERAQAVLAWLPFQYLFYFPAMTALGRVSPAEWAWGMGIALAWALAFGLAGRAVWKRGYRSYAGVGI